MGLNFKPIPADVPPVVLAVCANLAPSSRFQIDGRD